MFQIYILGVRLSRFNRSKASARSIATEQTREVEELDISYAEELQTVPETRSEPGGWGRSRRGWLDDHQQETGTRTIRILLKRPRLHQNSEGKSRFERKRARGERERRRTKRAALGTERFERRRRTTRRWRGELGEAFEASPFIGLVRRTASGWEGWGVEE